jgi:hypothetical protein
MTATVTVWSSANPPRRSWLDHVGRSLRAAFAKLSPFERGDIWEDRPVVAVGSVVRVFDIDSLREETIVVAPDQVAAYASVGVALIGAEEGATREWESPSGPRRLRIVGIVGRVPEGAAATAAHQRPPRATALRSPRTATRKIAA